MALFVQQVSAFLLKDFLILRRRWISTIFKCFLLPTTYGIFLACIPFFLLRWGESGHGSPSEVMPLEQHFNPSRPLYWADNTDGSGAVSPTIVMDRVTDKFSSKQKAAVRKTSNVLEMLDICTTNFVDISDCYIGLSFDNITPTNSTSPIRVEYTIWGDTRLKDLDGAGSESDLETKVFPLQWAIDKAVIELTTGTVPPTPQQWPVFPTKGRTPGPIRRGDFLTWFPLYGVIPFTAAFLGAVYRISGTIALERSTSLTAQMKSMGGSYIAQVLSWHISTSLTFLPTWIGLSIGWKLLLFTQTNVGFILLANILTGIALVGWSILAAVPFRSSPRLAAILITFAAIGATAGPAAEPEVKIFVSLPLCLFFPSAFYGYFLRAMSNFELTGLGLNMTREAEHSPVAVAKLFIPVVVLAFVWPILAITLEHRLYGIHQDKSPRNPPLPSGIALRFSGVGKIFKPLFDRAVVAIEDLSLDVPKNGMCVLLGPSGAGKSTTLAILGNLTSPTSGHVQLADELDVTTAPIGIVSQQNTLYPELTCLETLQFWDTLKRTQDRSTNEELTQLLRDCDLSEAAEHQARALSDCQQRLLQLAVGLVGGSKLILVDECTLGVDSIGRHAIWKALSIHKANRTMILATHCPYEAEYLADHIVVLTSPGKLVTSGTPVALKNSIGNGYTVGVAFTTKSATVADAALGFIRQSAPATEMKFDHQRGYVYSLKTKSLTTTTTVLRQLELNQSRLGVDSYEVISSTIEDIFPNLTKAVDEGDTPAPTGVEAVKEGPSADIPVSRAPLRLAPSRHVSIYNQVGTILWKRILLLKTRYPLHIAALVIGIAGLYAPLHLIYVPNYSTRPECFRQPPSYNAQHSSGFPLISPKGDYISGPATLTSALASSLDLQNVTSGVFVNQPDLSTFVETVDQERRNSTFSSALYADLQTKEVMIAWSRPDRAYDTRVFSLYSNLAMRAALRAQGVTQNTTLANRVGTFPTREIKATMDMPFVVVLGLFVAAYTSFATIHITAERASNVQAMMFSNGLTNPFGLWLGHLMYDSVVPTIISIAVAAMYSAYPERVQFLGPFWVVLWLYGIVGTLYAYVVAVFFKRPWAAFATCFFSQWVIGCLYLVGYLIWEFAAPKPQVAPLFDSLQYGLGFIFPMNNVFRAGLLSLNLYTFMCDPRASATVKGLDVVAMNRFGSPILYLLIWIFALLFVLVHLESNFSITDVFRRRTRGDQNTTDTATLKLESLEHAAAPVDEKDVIQVYGVTKFHGKAHRLDSISFSVPQGSVFAMLAPKGAGKTTIFDILCGKIRPDGGDVFLDGSSIVHNLKTAHLSFGACPHFSAVDRHLSVRNNLAVYGRLKGLRGGMELDGSIAEILAATKLQEYTDLPAGKLSSGDRRKLSLAIALIGTSLYPPIQPSHPRSFADEFLGNPSVILIDEISGGMDATTKRELWEILKVVLVDKAVFLTTRSLEEALCLANKIGFMSGRFIALGTPEELKANNATYDVHFSCQTPEDLSKVKRAMSCVTGACLVCDGANRFEVPIASSNYGPKQGFACVADLFDFLLSQEDLPPFLVGKSALESSLMRTINEGRVTA